MYDGVMSDLVPLSSRSKFDARILSMADTHTAREISEQLNGVISPASVKLRIDELLDEHNVLSDIQREQLVMIRLSKIVAEWEKMAGISTDAAKLSLGYLREIANRLDKRAARTQIDLNTLYGNQGKIMAQAYDLALSYMQGRFADLVPKAMWDEVATEALMVAQEKLDQHTAVNPA